MPLKRTLTLPLVTFYGLGTIIGAGIYALIGAVAQEAHAYTPFSFLLASFIALITAASYAELSSRFPESAGSALYVKKAFKYTWLSGLIGWLVVTTGLVSSATLAHGFVNYFQLFLPISYYLIIPVLIVILGLIAVWGIKESAITIFLMTLLEILGLLIIVWYGKNDFSKIIVDANQYLPPPNLQTWSAIFSGAFLAFYAFIGFEDMVNIVEEIKNPKKTLTLAIFIALFSATLLYLLISIVTITSLSVEQLSQSKTPLTLIIQLQGHSPILFGIIAMISITNGILVQIIMASRLLYGMAKHKTALKLFENIFEKTQVPLNGIIFSVVAIIILAYWFPLKTLAKMTSAIILCVFFMMHLSLIKIKLTRPNNQNGITLPIILPCLGALLSFIFILIEII